MVMKAFHIFFIIFYFLVSLPPFLKLSSSAQIDTITSIQSITDHRSNTTTLVSPGQTFELGFFSPGNSKKRYIGIWYKIAPDKVVWVANRDKPLTDLNGEFTIKNGNLVLFDRRRSIVWSSNVSSDSTKDRISLLLDSGNLVLKGTESLTEIFDWQSFDYPTDTLLPGMKVGWDLKTGLERYLTSWRNANDPSTGNVTFRMILNGLPRGVLEMKSIKKYLTGTWNGIGLSGVNFPSATVARIFDVVDEKEVYMAYEPTAHSVLQRIKISYSGFGEHLILRNGSTEWTVMYTLPTEQLCESYGYCGDNAICKSNGSPICDCLKGYTPRSQDEWRKMNWSEGCMRKIPLDCNHKAYGFLKIPQVKLPDLLDFWLNKTMNLKDCEEACLKNCSCAAYANSDVRNGGSGCLMWFGDLVDIRDMHIKGSEQDIYVRLSASEIKSIRAADKRKRLTIIVASSMTFGMCTVGIVCWCITLKLRNRPVIGKFNDEDIELPMFDLATIIAATSNFSQANKIGAGGFGPVYKGKLPTGQEIAVKRLSKSSGQGIKEFKNEIELIAKLQHRNLVALLGYCIHGEERILIYEYMPKKSLDHFIFDTRQNTSLPWKKNFDIIRGIARGLLYLHQDSKLNIIHRDLKASNILLDDNLNPKISDFGLARIFREDEKEARTRRVVGTYGYMSPEYAIDGKFSIKSDVFSFGVVLLETVSRKKNRNFRHPNHHHNLLGHAWLLWNEEKALDLMDECFKDSCVESEVLRCIQVGLLCVQKFPHNRPTMSSVVFMLENDGAVLPQPEQPGFFIERSLSDVQRSTPGNHQDLHSENMVTITTPCGR